MKITVLTRTFSLYPFESSELPDFTIITGKNGSGKTQLLNALNTNNAIISDLDGHIQLGRIEMQSIGSLDLQQSEELITNQDQYLHSIKFSTSNELVDKFLVYIINSNLAFEILYDENRIDLLIELADYKSLITSMYLWENVIEDNIYSADVPLPTLEELINYENKLIKEYYTSSNIEKIKYLIKFHNLNDDEKRTFLIMSRRLSQERLYEIDLFSLRIEKLFGTYLFRRFWNYIYYLKGKDFSNLLVTSDEEFILSNIPPWKIINEILSDNGLDFRFDEYELFDYEPDSSLLLKLKKISLDTYITPNELSSGEKIILGLLLRLFIVDISSGEIARPGILLLDEPDAHLHPQMVQFMMNVLKNSFVKKLGIKVILTTHSPTTVALASEGDLFEMKNGSQSSLMPIGKDDALKLLTGFLPTLSIDYRNHRQIFVESPIDIAYYQSIYDIIQTEKKLMHKLYFISSTKGKGNCSQVYEMVKALRNSGNTTSYGIVDQDKNNKEENFVFVHGIKERYSIENYLFDPLYIIAFLLSKKFGNIHSDLGLLTSFSEHRLGELSNEKLQECVDFFFLKFSERNLNYKTLGESISIEYSNGKIVNIPKKFLSEQGHHSLIPKLHRAFPTLFPERDDYNFNYSFINLIAKSYPLIPKSTTDLLERLSR